MEEVTELDELAKVRTQWERFDRNTAWLQAHASKIYPHYH